MCQIVCIDKDTAKEGICEIDDIVTIHDDDVDLTGLGYKGFKIVQVNGKTMFELKEMWKHPEQKRAVKISEAGVWAFMEEKEVWENENGVWCDFVNCPKYSHTLKDLTELDRTALKSTSVSMTEKDVVLAKCCEKIHLDVANNVEVADLNKVG